ncbi:hypothetical protein B0H19DRAFT_1237032 [Mycena capillaripes]|nr:hypothetical protein B0H19DRAFT_1237032 [Mycena capillaripes]
MSSAARKRTEGGRARKPCERRWQAQSREWTMSGKYILRWHDSTNGRDAGPAPDKWKRWESPGSAYFHVQGEARMNPAIHRQDGIQVVRCTSTGESDITRAIGMLGTRQDRESQQRDQDEHGDILSGRENRAIGNEQMKRGRKRVGHHRYQEVVLITKDVELTRERRWTSTAA